MILRLCVAAIGLIAASTMSSPTIAAILVEGAIGGQAMRLVAASDRVLISLDQTRHLVDWDRGQIYSVGARGRVQTTTIAAIPSNHDGDHFEITPWGAGPIIAGHVSVYHVLSRGSKICGEVLISAWMRPFLEQAIQAIDLLDRFDLMPATMQHRPCGQIGFSAFASAGWPLMIGAMDAPIFKTEMIRFDYQPTSAELTVPAPTR